MNSSIKVFGFFTILTGLIYPLFILGIGQTLFHQKVNGSLIRLNSVEIGSELIAQKFEKPIYFWPRPSAIDYNPMPSGGSNLSPTSTDLVTQVKDRTASGRSLDLLFTSGSGLDPHVSEDGVQAQIDRVARSRNVSRDLIEALVKKVSEPRQFYFLGEPRVNILMLNLELDKMK